MSTKQTVKSINQARNSAVSVLQALDGNGPPVDAQRELALAVMDLATAVEASIPLEVRFQAEMELREES